MARLFMGKQTVYKLSYFISHLNCHIVAMAFALVDNTLRDYATGKREVKRGRKLEANLQGMYVRIIVSRADFCRCIPQTSGTSQSEVSS